MDSAPKRVLFVNGVPIDKGGIEKAIINIYRGIDHGKLLIDFIVRKPQKGYYHEEIEAYGGRIFNLFEKTKYKGNTKWNFYMDLYWIFSFYRILKSKGPFCAVHIVYPNLDGLLIVAAAVAGVPVRIAHSRNTGFDDNEQPSLMRVLLRKFQLLAGKKYATHIWGCSKAACQYLFGQDIMKDKRAEVPPNPISIYDFINRPYNKNQACKQLNLSPEKVNFINVGRYALQKNQVFLLQFFAQMLKQRKDLHLILTGPGPLENEIRSQIIKLNIENHVTMLDRNTDIPLALAAADYFLLPSLYEGFGNVLIEAQAASIPCFVSDTCQPEPNLGLLDYISINKGAEYWADYILSKLQKTDNRKIDQARLLEYDTSRVAQHMQKVYLEGIKYEEASKQGLKEKGVS